MYRQRVSTLFTAALTALLAAVLVTPIAAVVWAGFVDEGRFTLGWFSDVLSDRLYRRGLVNSVALAAAVTVLCLVISVPLALLAERFDFRGRKLWLALIQVPMILPPFVGAIALKAVLSRNGGINELLAAWGFIDPTQAIDWLQYPFWSCVVLEALYLYPITFLNVQAALANIDPAMEQAAENLGAGPWRRFLRITLPLMRPGLFAGGTLVFIWSLTELGTPLMVGYRDVTAVQVFTQLENTNPEGDAYALVVVLLVMSTLLYLVGKSLLGRSAGAMLAKAGVAATPARLGWGASLLVTLPFAGVFLAAVLPHIGVFLVSFSATGMLEVNPARMTLEHHARLLHDFIHWGAPGRGIAGISIWNSLFYSVIATGLNLVFGFLIAYLIVRRRSGLTAALDGLAMLPLAVPGLVLAFGFFVVTQGRSPLAFLNPLHNDPTPLLVLAYAVRRLPFLVRSCAAGLEQTSEALEESASNLGATWLRTALTITIPLLAANFIAGGLLVFSRSMLEVSDSLILTFDRAHYPMTKAMLDLSDNPSSGVQAASALGVWCMALLIVTIGGASLALGKRLGALFRA